jgi:hypothetical protein
MSLPSYRHICAGLAATSDIAFAEYTSGLRYPAHLRALTRFWVLPAALSGDDSAELRGDVTAAFGGDAAI